MNKDFGYVYVIEDEKNICKIGFSKYIPNKRLYQISCTYHKDFKIAGFFKSKTALIDESKIHDLLSEFKIKGEWFKLTYKQIKDKLGSNFNFFDGSPELYDIDEDDFEEISNRKTKIRFILCIPNDLFQGLKLILQKRSWISKSSWILDAMYEKLKRDS